MSTNEVAIVDCNVTLAAMYGELALHAITIGDEPSAYHFAQLAAHKALFILPDQLSE